MNSIIKTVVVRIHRLLVLLVAFLLLPGWASAAVVFEDNFDDSPDWRSMESGSAETGGGSNVAWPTTAVPPLHWTSYRASIPKYSNHAAVKTFVIDSSAHRGSTGKALTYNSEVDGGYCSSCWTGGGIDKYLGDGGHQELFVRFWKKEPNNFPGGTTTGNETGVINSWCWGTSQYSVWNGSDIQPSLHHSSAGKLIRITALRRRLSQVPNPERYPSPDTSPTLIVNANRRFAPTYPHAAQFDTEERYAPNYQGGPERIWGNPPSNGGSNLAVPYLPTSADTWCGDNQWHMYEYYVKMNSAPDAADGIYRIWLDGNLAAERADVPWVKSGVDSNGTAMATATGWNWVMLPDNIASTAFPSENRVTMRFYIDDVVMYTPMSGSEPECGGNCLGGRLPVNYVIGSSDPAPPAAPSGLRVQ